MEVTRAGRVDEGAENQGEMNAAGRSQAGVLPFVRPGGGSDDALVERARNGDRAAFDALYRMHAGRVYGVCLRMVADAERAEQLTQDAFVLAWRRLDSFRGESAFTSWLHRLTVNVVLEASRRQSRREVREETMADLTVVDRGAGPPDVDTRLVLERAVAALPPGARTCLVLHDIEGYTHEEIAQLTGTAVGTTKAQLHRARRLLREMLGR
jgi:RNA polymerase sigma-70 factor (ECF subfamily)